MEPLARPRAMLGRIVVGLRLAVRTHVNARAARVSAMFIAFFGAAASLHILLFLALKPQGFAEIRDTYDLFAKTLGGLLVLVGLYLTFRRLIASEKIAEASLMTARATLDSQITDRFSRAIDQLGSEKLEIRLGGAYALERIAKDSARDYWPVMSTLAAFVREHAPVKAPGTQQGDVAPARADVLAVASVFSRRDRRERFGLLLPRTDLSGMCLSGACLENSTVAHSDLTKCTLEGATCPNADFTKATLRSAEMSNADLSGGRFIAANLEHATVLRSKLCGSQLAYANLKEANLCFADFRGTWLLGADFGRAKLVCANFANCDMSVIEDLRGADLRGADLSGSILWQLDLRGVDLRGANLAKAIVRGADLAGAILSGQQSRELLEEQILTRGELRRKLGDEFGGSFSRFSDDEQRQLLECSLLDALNLDPEHFLGKVDPIPDANSCLAGISPEIAACSAGASDSSDSPTTTKEREPNPRTSGSSDT
jgi:uncharacterized protein YjbI with pentapeptide repeats/uncharacterized membrane protein YdcZ (DUF606 family)